MPEREILNIDEAAELLGVSVKTFNKVLHSEDLPARKIGREWKFSRQALIEWVGSGRSSLFYRESGSDEGADAELVPAARSGPARDSAARELNSREPNSREPSSRESGSREQEAHDNGGRVRTRRTVGWQIEE
jgi:excisionase family DNA binding protein